MDRMNIEPIKYRNHELLSNQEIEIEHCYKCKKLTLHLITYNKGKIFDCECLRCKEHMCD